MGLSRPLLTDWWEEVRFSHITANIGCWLAVAISSGTNSTALPSAFITGRYPYGVFLRSSATTNSGMRYQTSSLISDFFGQVPHKFRATLFFPAFTTTTMRLGYLDTTASADSTDGAYFEFVGSGVVSAKTAAAGTRTTNATTYTMAANQFYTFDIEANAAGTSVRFRLYEGTNEVPVLDVSNTANIPTVLANAFGAGLVITNSAVANTDLCVLVEMGFGTRIPDDPLVETVGALTGTTPVLSHAAGTILTWTLSANSTPTDGLAAGQSLTLLVDDGTAFTITWPTITWINGSAPVLATSGNTVITLFKVGAALYGAY